MGVSKAEAGSYFVLKAANTDLFSKKVAQIKVMNRANFRSYFISVVIS